MALTKHLHSSFVCRRRLLWPLISYVVGMLQLHDGRRQVLGQTVMNLVSNQLSLVIAGLQHVFEGSPLPLQCLLGLFAGGDVFGQGDDVVNRSVILAEGTDMDRRVDDAPIFAEKTLVEGEVLDLACQEPVGQLEAWFQVIGMRQFGPVVLKEFFPGIAHDLAQPVIDLQKLFVERGYRHPDQSLIEVVAESAFALPQRLLCLPSFGDVMGDAGHADDVPAGIPDRRKCHGHV